MSCSTLSSLVRSGQARVCVPLIDANEAPLSAEEEEKREQKAARCLRPFRRPRMAMMMIMVMRTNAPRFHSSV